jgi:calcineurin-like phosphoesterase family protein
VIKLWSDTHFNHVGILKYCAATRPYANVAEMNEGMVVSWNAAVSAGDDIFFLGDFGFNSVETPLSAIFERLAGRKHLVIGNHDEQNKKVLALPWQTQRDLVTLKEQGVKAVGCHYPLETWKSAHHGALMVHGHSHGSLKRKIPHRFDVGVDVFSMPKSLQELALMAAEQDYVPQDHHGEGEER